MAENKEKLPEDPKYNLKSFTKDVVDWFRNQLKKSKKLWDKMNKNVEGKLYHSSDEDVKILGMTPGKMSYRKDSLLRRGGNIK